MNPRHEFVGFRGDDAGADHDLPVRPMPVLHEPCECEYMPIRGVEVERPFLFAFSLPFVEARCWDNAPVALEGTPEGRLLYKGLFPGVDRFRAGIRIVDPTGDEPPEGNIRHALALLWTHDHNVLAGGDVVALHDVEPRGDHPEGFSQALGAECEGVAAAHGKHDACNPHPRFRITCVVCRFRGRTWASSTATFRGQRLVTQFEPPPLWLGGPPVGPGPPGPRCAQSPGLCRDGSQAERFATFIWPPRLDSGTASPSRSEEHT